MIKALVFIAFAVCVFGRATVDFSFKRDALDEEEVTFSLALKQKNLDVLKQMVLDRSNPQHHLYSQWMSREEVNAVIAPSAAQKAPVLNFLSRSGIKVVEDRGDSFLLNAPAVIVERVFRTNVTVYEHNDSKRELFKCDAYHFPKALQSISEGLVGLQELPMRPSFGPKKHTNNKKKNTRKTQTESYDYGSVIPAFLRLIYSIPNTTVSANASLGLIEFMDYSSYSKDGLKSFLDETNNPPATVAQIVGPFGGDGLESVLDVQYGVALARGATIWFWTGQRWLLDWSQEFFAAQNVPQVVSQSWGWPSNLMCASEQGPGQCQNWTSQQYATRVESEYMKIAARGITIVAASGDQGAPGDGFYDCSPGLSDIMPASSTWATAVGATQLGPKPSGPSRLLKSRKAEAQPFGAKICRDFFHPLKPKCADGSNTYEVVCSSGNGALITSGGGFQAYFPQPLWQRKAVNSYLTNPNAQLPPGSMFNASNRAFPDVSALGHAYLIWDFTSENVDGTSASTPVFASMITLWNAQRLAAGKKTLGHMAPLLYQAYAADPTIFIDIVEGDNKCAESCCSQDGFKALPGWDAATGLGSVNWAKMSKYIATLP